ncbi:MAG: TonB-dependent receptor [Candidatus Eremiobacteraeota bacterium]|nr:TonB-dependent receptor [Candidatus Eremiobacteraeota bacterium]
MNGITRIFSTLAMAALAVGPVSAATGVNASAAQVAQSSVRSSSGAVAGTVTDDTGAPVANALVTLAGATQLTTTTDARGTFTFAAVPAAVYAFTARRAGYDTASENSVVVLAGQSQTLTVRMHAATLSSLRTIATVTSRNRATFNTTPASVNIVTSQAFVDQAQPQITRVLNQIPGVQISFPSSSANGAAPGSITVPTIRGAASYETASLIDGHPLATGAYGDYVTTFLSSYLLGSVETIKGPGADAPEVNNAIGGTLNFRTKDPTLTQTPTILFGYDSHGGTFSNFGVSDTVMDGRLGIVAQVATVDLPSALNGTQVFFNPNFSYVGGAGGTSLFVKPPKGPIANTESTNFTSYPLLACCFTIMGDLETTGELLKARYKLSSATTATVSYVGSQSFSDQVGNTGNLTFANFQPNDPTYTGPLKAGSPVAVDYLFAGESTRETNNEPIFQAETSTTLGNDTVLGRYYHASINRLQSAGGSPGGLDFNQVSLYGTNLGGPTYNGQSVSLGTQDFFRESEEDKLAGYTFQYSHPFGSSDDVSLSVDSTNSQSTAYSQSPNSFNLGPTTGVADSVSIPTGSSQIFTTYLVRSHLNVGTKVKVTLSDYQNQYHNTFALSCPLDSNGNYQCNPDGSNVIFTTTNTSHNDPRIGIVYQPRSTIAVRFATGSSIAPPYLGLLSNVPGGVVSYDAANNAAYVAVPNALIRPETAFGFDLGADIQLKDGVTTLSGDVYRTNLFNHFFGETLATGATCTPITCGGSGAPLGTPIYTQTTVNLSNSRFEGVELTLRHRPQYGFGYNVEGSLQRGYVYNLPANFYCSNAGPCTPGNGSYNQNLNIVPNENLNGAGIGFGSTVGSLNTRIPYAQGNVEFSYTFKNSTYAAFGETLYGKNNSLNEPPFGIAYATLRQPFGNGFAFQVSGDNIFNAYHSLIPVYGGGVAIPLAGGGTAATTANVLGPSVYRFVLTKSFP